ncbi:MAG: hypothetical protein F4X02_05145 [Chloroflexi bacterium]|nr:hypothetical protein [Chloroflexota bacterium]
MYEEERRRSWLALVVGLIVTVWGLSHLISGKPGAGKWFVLWLVSSVIVAVTGGAWLVVHVPVSIAAAWVGSK